jgi:transcriptional regulator with GAF, ATPase, and Fis domain
VNCASIPRELFESEFFGHSKGAFTSALRDRAGRFQAADGGTLFLDEIGEIPFELQSKLLRAVQEGQFERLGEERTRRVDVRIVAATNRTLTDEIVQGRFRQDLYYRLSVFPITLPPLRARIQDVPLLIDHFLSQAKGADGPETRRFSAEDAARLRGYQWPGNVRELRHVVLRAAIMSDPNDSVLRLPERFDSPFNEPNGQQGLAIGRSIRDVERELIMRTLEHLNGDKRAAAETLGISLNTLYNRLNAYEAAGIAPPTAPP